MKELQKDIFEWIEENKKDNVIFLCHCISSDWALGAGFAKEVQKRFQEREFLAHTPGFRSDWQGRGFSLITSHPTLSLKLNATFTFAIWLQRKNIGKSQLIQLWNRL